MTNLESIYQYRVMTR